MVMGSLRQDIDTVVIGSGPGGYVAALRLADLGKEVLLVEERERDGGTCLLEGCIPSKTLIHAVEVKESATAAARFGLGIGGWTFDLARLRVLDGGGRVRPVRRRRRPAEAARRAGPARPGALQLEPQPGDRGRRGQRHRLPALHHRHRVEPGVVA